MKKAARLGGLSWQRTGLRLRATAAAGAAATLFLGGRFFGGAATASGAFFGRAAAAFGSFAGAATAAAATAGLVRVAVG